MNEPAKGLARFRSIKQVSAGEITEVVAAGCYVKDADGTATLREYMPAMIARYTPIAGDFWIVYDGDGYQSISPRAQFLEGYQLLGTPNVSA